MDRLVIAPDLLAQVVSHCKACFPCEACGILGGRGGRVEKVYTLTNAEPSPVSYHIDPGEQFQVMKEMRRRGLEMVGIFHSHPQSSAYPSARDVGLASYPDSAYLIIGLSDFERPEVRAYEIVDGGITERTVEIG